MPPLDLSLLPRPPYEPMRLAWLCQLIAAVIAIVIGAAGGGADTAIAVDTAITADELIRLYDEAKGSEPLLQSRHAPLCLAPCQGTASFGPTAASLLQNSPALSLA